MPRRHPDGLTCNAGDSGATLERAIERADVAGALGAGAGLFDAGEVRLHPTGKVTIFSASHTPTTCRTTRWKPSRARLARTIRSA